ncbi:MAG: VOC family protein [Limnobacter sp.]|nr:VOC family protein [Limnobacter sp.]
MKVDPYLNFEGRCEEAIEFYRGAVGAELEVLMRYKEMPEPRDPGMVNPENENKVMHAEMRIGDSKLMLSDGDCAGTSSRFQGISLTITAADDAEAARVFSALADGGQVRMPLTKTFFSSGFGMLADRFGVPWLVVVQ